MTAGADAFGTEVAGEAGILAAILEEHPAAIYRAAIAANTACESPMRHTTLPCLRHEVQSPEKAADVLAEQDLTETYALCTTSWNEIAEYLRRIRRVASTERSHAV